MKPEKCCPECKGEITWKVVRAALGAPAYNGLCKKCNIVLRGRETPSISKGKELEKNGRIGTKLVKNLDAMDKRILRLPGDVQLGILRQREHG